MKMDKGKWGLMFMMAMILVTGALTACQRENALESSEDEEETIETIREETQEEEDLFAEYVDTWYILADQSLESIRFDDQYHWTMYDREGLLLAEGYSACNEDKTLSLYTDNDEEFGQAVLNGEELALILTGDFWDLTADYDEDDLWSRRIDSESAEVFDDEANQGVYGEVDDHESLDELYG